MNVALCLILAILIILNLRTIAGALTIIGIVSAIVIYFAVGMIAMALFLLVDAARWLARWSTIQVRKMLHWVK